jgi:Raf kinase inhibitor-like YbhB/YbcL family protein
LKEIIYFLFLAVLVSPQIIMAKGNKLADSFQLFSKVFKDGEEIPERYSSTRDGQNISPPLHWVNPPKGTQRFALIVEDLDIPLGFIFTHWVLYNIPADKQELMEGVPRQKVFGDGIIQGKNSWMKNEYYGLNPVWGTHRYRFTIYALDTGMKQDLNLNKKKLLRAIAGHILSQAQLVGCYSKK